MSLEEQLLNLVGRRVVLAGIPADEFAYSRLRVKQDYIYELSWLSFSSAEVAEIIGATIYFQPGYVSEINALITDGTLVDDSGPDMGPTLTSEAEAYYYYLKHPLRDDDEF